MIAASAMFPLIIFVVGAMFVLAYSLWEVRSIWSITIAQAAGVGTAALIVLFLLVFIFWRSAH
jgi:hypothetical protein